VSTSLAEINVVPLVDVMLVLLIIFMVTAPMIQRGMDVNLPVARRAAQIEGERLFVTVPATFRQDRSVYLGDERIRVDVLQERIRQKMETATDKQVYLRGDGDVLYHDLMDVFDRLKGAGVERVGLVAKLPGER
jgi:biopolymer transport protein ExbD